MTFVQGLTSSLKFMNWRHMRAHSNAFSVISSQEDNIVLITNTMINSKSRRKNKSLAWYFYVLYEEYVKDTDLKW